MSEVLSLRAYWKKYRRGGYVDGLYLRMGDDDCPECQGKGRVFCDECDGDGCIGCSHCDGGYEDECGECDSDGVIDCKVCKGKGDVLCPECDGIGASGAMKDEYLRLLCRENSPGEDRVESFEGLPLFLAASLDLMSKARGVCDADG